jgi:hypothetical protein
MKKLLSALAISLIFTACSKEGDDINTGDATFESRITTNVLRFAEDFTDDGIENFIEQQQVDYPYPVVIYHKGVEKKVVINQFDGNGREILLTEYIIDSEKNGNVMCHNGSESIIFRFVSFTEVHAIIKYSIGLRKIRYIKKF